MTEPLPNYDYWKLQSPHEGPSCPDCGGGLEEDATGALFCSQCREQDEAIRTAGTRLLMTCRKCGGRLEPSPDGFGLWCPACAVADAARGLEPADADRIELGEVL